MLSDEIGSEGLRMYMLS